VNRRFRATVDDLPHVSAPPVSGLAARRSVGVNGTRLSACRADQALGYIEVDTNLTMPAGWPDWKMGDIGNIHVEEAFAGAGSLLAGRPAVTGCACAHRLLGYAAEHEDCSAAAQARADELTHPTLANCPGLHPGPRATRCMDAANYCHITSP
jgi:hypothetical protein